MGVFGMSMNNGKKLIGLGKTTNSAACNLTADLPENLAKITVYLTKDKKWMHSMVFEGTTTLSIGCKPEDESKRSIDNRKGGSLTCEFANGEQLLGCKLHYCQKGTFGVTWLKWRPPTTKYEV